MSFSYGFYNSMNGDRKYNAEQVSAIFDGLITDGVFDSIGDIFATTPGEGLQIVVGSGKAWFHHTWNVNDSALPLSIDTPDVLLPRIDAVVIEVNNMRDARENTLKIIKGTPSSTPTKPELVRTEVGEGINQYALAYITVNQNAETITASNIEINVGKSDCPFVTSIVQSTDIDALFNQWNGEFDEWFENIKNQLSGDVVANLQRQIDEKVDKIKDKANMDDIANGTPNKWVDSKIISNLYSLYPKNFNNFGEEIITDSNLFDLSGDIIPFLYSSKYKKIIYRRTWKESNDIENYYGRFSYILYDMETKKTKTLLSFNHSINNSTYLPDVCIHNTWHDDVLILYNKYHNEHGGICYIFDTDELIELPSGLFVDYNENSNISTISENYFETKDYVGYFDGSVYNNRRIYYMNKQTKIIKKVGFNNAYDSNNNSIKFYGVYNNTICFLTISDRNGTKQFGTINFLEDDTVSILYNTDNIIYKSYFDIIYIKDRYCYAAGFKDETNTLTIRNTLLVIDIQSGKITNKNEYLNSDASKSQYISNYSYKQIVNNKIYMFYYNGSGTNHFFSYIIIDLITNSVIKTHDSEIYFRGIAIPNPAGSHIVHKLKPIELILDKFILLYTYLIDVSSDDLLFDYLFLPTYLSITNATSSEITMNFNLLYYTTIFMDGFNPKEFLAFDKLNRMYKLVNYIFQYNPNSQ